MSKRKVWLIGFVLAVALAPALALAEGALEIRIKDHREAIGDFTSLMLTIDKIAISPKAGMKFWRSGWQPLTPLITDTIDLTKYVDKQSVQVFHGKLADGSFDGIDLKLKKVAGTLKKSKRTPKIKNSVTAIKLPFQISSSQTTAIVLDLVILDMSDHPPQDYELGIKGWELYRNGKLVDKLPPG
ncbi:MAG: DUF4382 domain-containing protein [Deltaproteobacteria bacterium]|nr:DUF4382 domain-containing protein [Deltaproteobacteria bacterium]